MDVSSLPQTAGVYILKNENNKPIYVGKASNIRKRVKDHLSLKDFGAKSQVIAEKTKNIDTIRLDSEIEALILEAALIKKFKPVYNTQLKDDKDYLYIKITKSEFPKVAAARKRDLQDAKTYFGPFPSATKVRTTLRTIRKVFPYSTCKPNQKRPCLHFHLGLCPGVCAGVIKKEDYLKTIRRISLFLQGKKNRLLKALEREQQVETRRLNFEKAAEIQRKIEAINYITKPRIGLEFLDENLEVERKKELKELKEFLKMPKKPVRIECYDISNISGKQASGSMVVFTDGFADKNEYKRFKIKSVHGANDPAMIKEVLTRRFRNDWPKPDLIVIDGGKPQLSAAKSLLKEKSLKIPVITLAKKFEEIYMEGRVKPIKLSRDQAALRLIQRIRDEAHRFALAYHRKLRSQQFLTKERGFVRL